MGEKKWLMKRRKMMDDKGADCRTKDCVWEMVKFFCREPFYFAPFPFFICLTRRMSPWLNIQVLSQPLEPPLPTHTHTSYTQTEPLDRPLNLSP